MSKQPEEKLVDCFERYCKNNGLKFIHKEKGKRGKNMDVEIIYKGQYLRLEAKSYTDNFYQAVLLIFGNILKGRNLDLANPEEEYSSVCYGVLIPHKSEEEFKKQWQNIDIQDWKSFGESYNVNYIVVCDETCKNSNVVNFYKWDNYL